MPNAGLRVRVAPIETEPSPRGLLGGCVPVVQAGSVHELNGTDVPAFNCAPASPWQDCPDPAGGWTNPASKVTNRLGYCSFEPVTAYSKVDCSVVGLSFEESQAAALEQVRLGEQAVLEEWFMRRGLSWLAFGNDLTPGAGAVHIAQGIGLLEAWLSTEYGGSGVIHVPVGAATLVSMNRLTDWPGEGNPTTLAGNCVVLGGGYSANVGPAEAPAAGAVAPAGEAWLYATGAMRIRRDQAANVFENEWQGINTSVNDRTAAAESTFVPEVDCCMAAAVRISLNPCCA